MALAARGARNMDGGPQPIDDAAALAQIRRQAFRVYLKSIALGVVLTLACFLLPV